MQNDRSGSVGRSTEYSQVAAVYRQAVTDVHNREVDAEGAVARAADRLEIELSKEATADLEWVVELEAKKLDQNPDHSLSFLHEWFDGETLHLLQPDANREDGDHDE